MNLDLFSHWFSTWPIKTNHCDTISATVATDDGVKPGVALVTSLFAQVRGVDVYAVLPLVTLWILKLFSSIPYALMRDTLLYSLKHSRSGMTHKVFKS